MILLNVLLFVALTAGIVALMIAREDDGLSRATRLREAARAMAAARGGEASALTALRRDAATAPDNDNAAEPWGRIAERRRAIAGGTFDLAIADATGRFNVNAILGTDPAPAALFLRIAERAGIGPAEAQAAMAALRAAGPIGDVAAVADRIDPAVAGKLAGLVTALPYPTGVNLNAADLPVLSLLTGDTAVAERLVAQRMRRGFLTAADFSEAGLAVPPGAGFMSDCYWVRTRVTIGDTAQQLTSLIVRRRLPDGSIAAAVVQRWIGGRPPAQAPALP